MTRQKLLAPVDVACLWIGTNDAIGMPSRAAAIYRTIRRQPQAWDAREFYTYYQAILDLLHSHASQVITASPLCIGEDLSNPANQSVARLSTDDRPGLSIVREYPVSRSARDPGCKAGRESRSRRIDLETCCRWCWMR